MKYIITPFWMFGNSTLFRTEKCYSKKLSGGFPVRRNVTAAVKLIALQ